MTRALIAALLIGVPLTAAAQDIPCNPVLDPETLAATDEALMGLPVSAAGGSADGHRAVWCHDRFCLQYNSVTKGPDWVIERLGPDITDGKHTRPKIKFRADPTALDKDLPSAIDRDYTHSGFDRGHMAASADFKCSADWMKQTFVLSNAVPQIGAGFNRTIWKYLEEQVQAFASQEEIYVITGPVPIPADGKVRRLSAHQAGCGNRLELPGKLALGREKICNGSKNDPTNKCAAGVEIPAGLFKVIYVPKTERAIGFVMPNQDHTPLRNDLNLTDDKYLDRWRVSIRAIEDLAGLELFPRNGNRRQTVTETNCPATRWR